MQKTRSFYTLSLLTLSCLLFLTSACGASVSQAATTNVQQQAIVSMNNPTAQKSSASPIATPAITVAMPPTQTSCPADGTARPAIIKTLVLGPHPSLVYIYNDIPQNTSIAYGILNRYDVVTGQQQQIVSSGLSIGDAQVSADGQWVLFASQLDPRGNPKYDQALQLVRMDGSGLQTLYCTPANVIISNLQWSADQQSILFETLDQSAISETVRLLNVATGQMHVELQAPAIGTNTVMTWLDNTRAYIIHNPPQPDALSPGLYLLDTGEDNDTHSSDMEKIADFHLAQTTIGSNSADSSYDGETLFISTCQTASSSTIKSQPSDENVGNQQQTLYNNLHGCVNGLRAIDNKTLLFINDVSGGDFGTDVVMTAKIDGSGTTSLYDNGGAHTAIELNQYTQFPWSNVSRDGRWYAFNVRGIMTGTSTVEFASLTGGKATAIASTMSGQVSLIGWTMM